MNTSDSKARALLCRIDSSLMKGMDRMASNVMVPISDLQELCRMAGAAQRPGQVTVPAQATQDMYAAWMCSEGRWADRYKAMLAARPGAAND